MTRNIIGIFFNLKPLASRSLSLRNAASVPSTGCSIEEELTQEGAGVAYGLKLALAAKGVIVKDKLSYLKRHEIQHRVPTIPESVSGLPVLMRGNVVGETTKISKAEFGRLLKQVTSHISSISNVYIYDGTIGSSFKCDAKVRVISDSLSAISPLSNLLWTTTPRSVSHDTCPLTVYIASSISQGVSSNINLGSHGKRGFIAADIGRSSLVLCGQAFSDVSGLVGVLTALACPILCARGGVPLTAWLLESTSSTIILFAPADIMRSCLDRLVCADVGVVLTDNGVAPMFQTTNPGSPYIYKLPAALVLVSSDSSGWIPLASKLTPEQAVYHFLAGYQNGKFIPAYCKGPWPIDPLDLSKALLAKLKHHQIQSLLINATQGDRHMTGNDVVELAKSFLSEDIPPFKPKGAGLRGKYRSFLSSKFQLIPDEFNS